MTTGELAQYETAVYLYACEAMGLVYAPCLALRIRDMRREKRDAK